MLRVMLQKLWHKKWMVLCLLLGSLLLIATVVSFPLYRGAAFDRMLTDEFENYLAENGIWPARNAMSTISQKDYKGKAINKMEEMLAEMESRLGVSKKESISYYSLAKSKLESEWNRADAADISLKIGYISNLPEHVKILSGEMYSEEGKSEDGAFEVIISQACMTDNNLVVGETLQYKSLKDKDGQKIRLKIVGVYEEADKKDFYWQPQTNASALSTVCLINENLFRENFLGDNAGKYSINCNYFYLFEYSDLKAGQVERLLEETKWFLEESPIRSTMDQPVYPELLESFNRKKLRIETTLFILQVPVLILLCAFLFMISGQMYDMERNEISVMKSRGGSSGQMFRLYLYQSVLLALLGAAAGIPLGTVFCRVLGSARNFLEFDIRGELNITFTGEVWLYCLAGILASVLIMTVPALKHSRLTIVKLKQSNALKKRALWEKLFLDVICLAIGVYGYYSYSRNGNVMTQDVLLGKSLDPLLYMSSALFIVGMGLLFLRLQPLLIRLVYFLGKPFWRPASYASFMENIKNGRKQQFIMLFMILTISLGMYHAVVARTILQNARDNAEYMEAADIMMKEVWLNSQDTGFGGAKADFRYYEPDYRRFASVPGVESFTKVLYEEKAAVKMNSGSAVTQCTLMGIHTKEFGQITYVADELLKKPYYEYLNELAREPEGLLVSRNFQTLHGFKEGDSLQYQNEKGKRATGKIVDFLDYWPGYEPSSVVLTTDGNVETMNNLLVVANIATVQRNFEVTPYEIWFSLKEGASSDGVYQWIEDNGIRVSKFTDKAVQLKKVVEDPLLQGTNGVLTMGFIVTIILCGVGYLIYWIMSIRSREMIFGVLRACGMHKGELFHMLINEQIFSGVLSIFAGIGIGTLTSKMFVPMLQTAYAASNQVLPMKLITNPDDMIRLYGVVGIVMALCLVVLILLVFKLNVTKALKLGEE
ncbi:MAG: ABC transporter permease [Roseburia sp.]|nr:ABC transporter permease [Roseburia sp.]